MRKFIYFKSVIYECEVSIVAPRPYECKGDEQLYVLTSPSEFLHEKWYSQFFCDSIEEAQAKAEEVIRFDAKHLLSKKGIAFTEEDIQERLRSVQIKKLDRTI